MTKRRIVALAAAAATLVTWPAFAVRAPAGSVGLWAVPTHAAMDTNFTGDILAFTARGNADVACRSISATFDDGTVSAIYGGTLAPDDQVEMRLPGGARNVRRLDFDCWSVDKGRAVLNVTADLVPRTVLVPLG